MLKPISTSRYSLLWLLLAALLAASLPARALTIDIVGAGTNAIPVVILPFGGEQELAAPLTPVIREDLRQSGRFNVLATDGAPASYDIDGVDLTPWKGRGAHAVAVGRVERAGADGFRVAFRLFDVARGEALTGAGIQFRAGDSRRTAHRIADMIFEALTGIRGAFATRIAYVTKQGGTYQLSVADADGHDARVVLTSREPIISPTWSPDGNRLAYVSFEKKKPEVYVQNVFTGARKAVASFKGNNSAPAWSPDGRELAVVLTRDGNSQIYLVAADGGGQPRRLLSSPAIDTEPAFSPDGKFIYFTSDRGGSPQIYRVPVAGGSPSRVSFEGGYNVSPALSPDGSRMAHVTRESGFRVAVRDLASGQTQVVSRTRGDESPSFSPNGEMILYATEEGGRGMLYAVSRDGRAGYRLSVPAGDVREPDWGPFTAP